VIWHAPGRAGLATENALAYLTPSYRANLRGTIDRRRQIGTTGNQSREKCWPRQIAASDLVMRASQDLRLAGGGVGSVSFLD